MPCETFWTGYTRRGLTDRFFKAKIDRAGRAEYITIATKNLGNSFSI